MDRRGSHKGYVRAKNNQAGFEVRERPIELEHVSYNREGQYNAALDSMEDGTNEALVNGNSDEACVQTKIPKLTGAKKELYDHNSTTFFDDGVRKIDFVLVWDELLPSNVSEISDCKREVFESNLEKEGLQIEYVDTPGVSLHFIKLHAPDEVLRRYAEILKLRMPMKKIEQDVINCDGSTSMEFLLKIPGMLQFHNATNEIVHEVKSRFDSILDYFRPDPHLFPVKAQRFSAVYSRDKEYLFNVEDEDFFTSSIRSRIVDFILKRKRFKEDTDDEFAFGIERLLTEGVYSAAYPLHDGSDHVDGNLRSLLRTEWTALNKLHRYQPLDYVKDYFGVKIALYFAWLGFYTHTLLFASVVGFFCFLFSFLSLPSNIPSNDICSGRFNVVMCPICDYSGDNSCDYWYIFETCLHSRAAYLFDNGTTVFFAVFMSFWAVLFLEMWKRYSAEITHRWDLTGFDHQEEHPRPQYLARLTHVKAKRVNVVTQTLEPRVPFWRIKVPAALLSISLILLLVSMAMASVMGVILYRMSLLASLSIHNDQNITANAMLITTATAAFINLCCILLFNRFYEKIALWLTEQELPRTQSEFEDSLTLKMYLLQFVNHYASIFYIAFFKGKFIGYPGDYNRFFGYRQEECGTGGCLVELCIQLAIIMVGKQAMNTCMEMVLPMVFKWFNSIRVRTGMGKQPKESQAYKAQWAKDYQLVAWGSEALFAEYLEMVLQYGFVTIFVAAFPLAPLFALLNNVLEMRLDARKILTLHRRPVAQRVKDIGVWYTILDCLGKLSVATNGLIIAFTSDFIPRLIYTLKYSPDHSLSGYVNYTLAYFSTADFSHAQQVSNASAAVDICRYRDLRETPWLPSNPQEPNPNKYALSADFWYILAARLTFVLVFQNFVALVTMVIRWIIPDVPRKLSERIRQEAYFTNEIIIKQEMIRARGSVRGAQAARGDSTARLLRPRSYVEPQNIPPSPYDDGVLFKRSKSSCPRISTGKSIDAV